MPMSSMSCGRRVFGPCAWRKVLVVLSFLFSLLLCREPGRLGSVGAFAPPSSVRSSTRTGLWAVPRKGAPIKRRKGSNKKGSKRAGLPRSRKTQSSQRVRFSGPRPRITDYHANRNNERVNLRRMEQDDIGCEHFGLCSGCSVSSRVGTVPIVESAQRYFSSASVRRRRADVMRDRNKAWTVEEASDGFYQVVVPSEVTGWRTQAKLVAANKSSSWTRDGCQFGLYQRGTHKLLPIPNCQVHHPSINRAVALLEQATAKVGTSAYSEESREGSLRYVQLQVERTSGKVCLTLIWNAADLKQTQPALARLIKELNRLDPTLWHSMWCHLNDGLGNNIFSRNPSRWHRLFGVEYMREPLPVGDVGWLYFSPMSFRQGNLDGFDILANDVARAVPGGSKVCELYAGVGTLGLTALVHHESFEGERPLEWIRCSDENPNSARCFYRSCDSLPPHITGRVDKSSQRTKSQGDDEEGMSLAELAQMMQTGIRPFHGKQEQKAEKTSYVIASAAKALKMGQALGANVLIVDPPRKGLEEEVLAELCMPFNPDQPYVESATLLTIPDEEVNWTNDVQTLIYVSCGFDGLARDCDALLSSKEGGWVLQSATGYILFPGSDHVETVAIFQRK